MKILRKDLRNGKISIETENPDDLWYLSQIVETGDMVQGSTIRKIKLGDENNPTIIRKRLNLTIEVEKVEFSTTASWLRILGVIRDGPDDVPRGTHHTINVQENERLKIIKQQWLKYQLDKLEDATKLNDSKILIVVFDREEATFALLNRRGYDVLTEISGDVRKKDIETQAKGSFFADLARLTADYDKRYSPKHIIFASSTIWKDYVRKELPEAVLKKTVFTTSNATGKNGINEVLKRPELKETLRDERVAEEIGLVDEVLAAVSQQGLAAYGIQNVEYASHIGAVEYLLVSDAALQRSREDGTYPRIEAMMKNAEQMRGSVHIISSENDGGKKLDGIGGIAAKLRYAL